MKSNSKLYLGIGLLVFALCFTTAQGQLGPIKWLKAILKFADSNVATELIAAGLGIKRKGTCTTPYPAHSNCPASTYPPSGTRWPRRIEAIKYLTGSIRGIPFTDALDIYVIGAVQSLASNGGVKSLSKCLNRTTDWLCTYIHGSLSFSSECTPNQKIEDFMPCKDHCEAVIQDCLDGAIDFALERLLGVSVDMTISTGNFVLDLALGVAIRLIPMKGELLAFPSQLICSKLGDFGANCNHVPDNGSVIDGGGARAATAGSSTLMWVLIAIGILLAIAGGLFIGAAIRKRNQEEVLDAYKTMETQATDAWGRMSGVSAVTADPAVGYKSGYTQSRLSATTASTAVGYKSGFTQKRNSAVTAGTAASYSSGYTSRVSAVTAGPGVPYVSGFTGSKGSRGTSKSNASKGTRSSSGHSKGRSSSKSRTSSSGGRSRGSSSGGRSRGSSSGGRSRGSSAVHSKGRSSSKSRTSSSGSRSRGSSTGSKGRSRGSSSGSHGRSRGSSSGSKGRH